MPTVASPFAGTVTLAGSREQRRSRRSPAPRQSEERSLKKPSKITCRRAPGSSSHRSPRRRRGCAGRRSASPSCHPQSGSGIVEAPFWMGTRTRSCSQNVHQARSLLARSSRHRCPWADRRRGGCAHDEVLDDVHLLVTHRGEEPGSFLNTFKHDARRRSERRHGRAGHEPMRRQAFRR